MSSNVLLSKINDYSDKGLLTIDSDVRTELDTGGKCLGISYTKNATYDNSKISLSTWDCADRKTVTCKIDTTESIVPPKPAKFPCITDSREARKKREIEETGTSFSIKICYVLSIKCNYKSWLNIQFLSSLCF